MFGFSTVLREFGGVDATGLLSERFARECDKRFPKVSFLRKNVLAKQAVAKYKPQITQRSAMEMDRVRTVIAGARGKTSFVGQKVGISPNARVLRALSDGVVEVRPRARG
jgi:hypothetical protein